MQGIAIVTPAPVPHLVPEGVAPWLANGEPLDLPDQLRAQALSSRRHPRQIQHKDLQGCWDAFVNRTERSYRLDVDSCYQKRV